MASHLTRPLTATSSRPRGSKITAVEPATKIETKAGSVGFSAVTRDTAIACAVTAPAKSIAGPATGARARRLGLESLTSRTTQAVASRPAVPTANHRSATSTARARDGIDRTRNEFTVQLDQQPGSK